MADPLEQWQVIARVAVEVAVLQIKSLFLQPEFEAGDLALLVAGNAADPAQVATILHGALGGQQVFHAQPCGNWSGDETVGGGNDQQLVTLAAMLCQQRLAFGQNQWLDHLGHELGMPLCEDGHRCAAENCLAEILIGHNVQFAGTVIGIKRIVAGLVGAGVDMAVPAEEFAPAVITVASQKGIVEIKESQAHG